MVSPKVRTTKAANYKNRTDKIKMGLMEKVTRPPHRSNNSFKSIFLHTNKRQISSKGSSDFNIVLK
jgi:hypothetical protein